MPELTELDVFERPPIISARAEPDDEYPHPEPLDPKQIDKRKSEYEFEYEYEDEEDEDDESNYSS